MTFKRLDQRRARYSR